jgi:heterodisulfide reductase subunit A
MMTAYATVETAVEAMKIGALDYLIKPFDPETLVPMVLRIYQDFALAEGRQLEVGALVLCGGTSFYDPSAGKNTYGYKIYPNVVTSLEFERLLSGTGPQAGHLARPLDGKPVHRIAWIQCVGSRDIQMAADFCSSICCMYAIKEALLAKEKIGPDLEATIFYMDMRTFGKSFQRYRDRAETIHGVCFERGRAHSVMQDPDSGDLIVRSVDIHGEPREVPFDLVVLTVGQRPTEGIAEMVGMLGIEQNSWGFAQTEPFSLTRTNQTGILLGGSFSGLNDIADSVTRASAAALNASRVIHSAGGSLALEPPPVAPTADVTRQPPKVLVVVCTCTDQLMQWLDPQKVAQHLTADPLVNRVEFLDKICTATGWERLVGLMKTNKANRLLIGACLPCGYKRKLQELGRQAGMNPALIEVVDINTHGAGQKAQLKEKDLVLRNILAALETGIARLKWINPQPVVKIPVVQRAMVVGGGIAGMTAALSIADHGFEVDLVEQTAQLGGNLTWVKRSLEGYTTDSLLEENCTRVEKHPGIRLHKQSRVVHTIGEVGNFHTTIEGPENTVHSLKHGVTVLATGGSEASTTSYGYGTSPAIITQKELEQKLSDNSIDPQKLNSVVMIQCVDSREGPRNYCSRVCCANALKQALYLKESNPAIAIYILYRDLMAYGFSETYYTQARKADVIFIQYDVDQKPTVQAAKNGLEVTVLEPIVGQHLQIKPDLLVLATGIVPNLPQDLVQMFGATIDQDGFFQEAESKWRPVDSLKEGVFACGLAHSPRNIAESITTAEAAAQRALRILSHEQLPAGKLVASVRHSLCSLCERCIDACPYGARTIDKDHEMVRVNPVMCQGCGSCAAVCPNSASILEGFQGQQMFEIIDAALN